MQTYLFSLIGAALTAAFFGILTPNGDGGKMSAHMRLLVALFFICVLIAPLKSALDTCIEFVNGELQLPGTNDSGQEDYQKQLEEAIDNSSKSYFTQMLTKTLESTFSINTGNIRCTVHWEEQETEFRPIRVTLILSGEAIWQDPEALESFVTDLLGCECVTAIDLYDRKS